MTAVAPATPAADLAGWDALLADGGVVRIRPITPDDATALRALHDAASDRSIYLRYFSLNRRAGERYVDHLLDAGDDSDRTPRAADGRRGGGRGPAPPDSALADEVPELAELDLNPVVVRPDGVVAVDVKVRLAPVAADADLLRDPLLRRLR